MMSKGETVSQVFYDFKLEINYAVDEMDIEHEQIFNKYYPRSH